MKQILQICKSLPFEVKGGIQTHVWELSLSLQRKGYKVSILSAGSFQKGIQQEQREGVEIIRIPYFPGRRIPLVGKTCDEMFFNLAVMGWLRKHHHSYGVIHCHGRSGLFIPSEVHPSKTCITFHGLAQVEYYHSYIQNRRFSFDLWIHQLINRHTEKVAYQRASKVIAVSKDLKVNLEKIYGSRRGGIKIIPNGIISRYFADQVAREKLICFVGRFHQIKGIMLLPEILSYLPAEVKMVCIGGGPDEEALKRKVNVMGLAHRVIFPGFLGKEEIYTWMRRASCMLMPSRNETFGIVVLEAGMCSLPVVAADIPALHEIIDHGEDGFLAKKDEVAEYVLYVKEILNDEEMAEALGTALQEKVCRKYTWSAVSDQVIDVYRTSIEKKDAEMAL
ncbi:MAG: glycosyltransferase family 4 protein [Bacteroidota bacterium]